MRSYFTLIKTDNLLIIALSQLFIKYGLFEPFGIEITLNGFGIFLLVVATIAIAAAGNIILEIYDLEGKVFQHMSISEKTANRLFLIFNAIGVLIGFYLANLIFILSSGLFYLYASYLKEILVVKNLIIALLVALAIIVVGIFDLLPVITEKNRETQTVMFSIIADYAIFAFILIVMREIVKDCLNIDKDHNSGIKTIPIVIGKNRAIKYTGIATLLPIAAVVYYIYTYLFSNTKAVVFMLLLLVAPLLYFMIKSFNTTSDKDIIHLKLVLKVILLLAAISLLFYQFALIN